MLVYVSQVGCGKLALLHVPLYVCYVCHNLNYSYVSLLSPPLADRYSSFKGRYIRDGQLCVSIFIIGGAG